MNTRPSRLYLAYNRPQTKDRPGPNSAGDYVAEMEPEEAAEYIAALLGSLRGIAVNAKLRMLSDLLYVAEEEAKLHCGS
ncbi:MAG: hypothetical protein WCD20_11205 [Rhodomicrobium sp.]